MQIRRERLVKKPLASGPGVDLHSAPLKNIPVTGLSQLESKGDPEIVPMDSVLIPAELVFWGYCKPRRGWALKPSIPAYSTLKSSILL